METIISKLALCTNTETNDRFTSLIIETEREYFIIENVGQAEAKSLTDGTIYDSYSDIFTLAEQQRKSSIIFVPNFQENNTLIDCQFSNLNGFFEIGNERTKREFLFFDSFVSWSKSAERSSDTAVFISRPDGAVFLPETGADLIKQYPNPHDLVTLLQTTKIELLKWFINSVPEYVKAPTEIFNIITDTFGVFPMGARNRVIEAIRRTPQDFEKLTTAGVTADYLAELGRFGKNGTKTALLKGASNTLQKAIADNDIKAVGDVIKDLQRVEQYNSNQSIIERLNRSFYDWENDWQTGDDITTDLQLLFDGQDGQTHELRKLTFSNCGVSVVVAPTKHGKTTFMIDTAIKQALKKPDEVVLYFSIEENEQQIVTKIYRHFASNYNELEAGDGVLNNLRRWSKSYDYNESEKFNKIRQGAQMVSNLKPLRLATDIDTAISQIRSVLQNEREHGRKINCLFLDYIQLLRAQKQAYSRTDEISYICNALNDFCKSENIGVITGAQFNREAKKAENLDVWGIALIGDSQSIENIATDVYLLANTSMCGDSAFNTTTKRGARIVNNTPIGRKNETFFYLENLISREHKGGGFCVVSVNMAFGIVADSANDGNDIFNNVPTLKYLR